jgi:tetratricopeptide (TPR) repeat protein
MSRLRIIGRGLRVVALWLSFILSANAQVLRSTQAEKAETRTGNKLFEKENYTDAEAAYKKALDKKADMPEATFNLGDALYKQKRFDDAVKQFQLSAQNNPDDKVKAKAYHNMGNAYLEQRKWEDAIRYYKDALKLNDKDADTKYNLAYANSMIVKEKNEQQKNNKDKDKKDKDKDKKQDQNQNKNQKPDSKQDDQQAKNDPKNQKGGQPKMTKADAEKLLQALMNEEQKTNQKVQQKEMKPVNAKIQKDW